MTRPDTPGVALTADERGLIAVQRRRYAAGRISDTDLLVTQRREAVDGARAAGDQP